MTNAPLAIGDTLYLINDKGEISALRAQPIAPRAARNKPKPAEAPAPEAPPRSDADGPVPAPGG